MASRGFALLPDELLLYILYGLPLATRMQARLACSRFASLLRAALMYPVFPINAAPRTWYSAPTLRYLLLHAARRQHAEGVAWVLDAWDSLAQAETPAQRIRREQNVLQWENKA